jgi:hypothetical protein
VPDGAGAAGLDDMAAANSNKSNSGTRMPPALEEESAATTLSSITTSGAPPASAALAVKAKTVVPAIKSLRIFLSPIFFCWDDCHKRVVSFDKLVNCFRHIWPILAPNHQLYMAKRHRGGVLSDRFGTRKICKS